MSLRQYLFKRYNCVPYLSLKGVHYNNKAVNISISNVHNSTVWKGSALCDKVTGFVPLSLWVCERNKLALSVGRVLTSTSDLINEQQHIHCQVRPRNSFQHGKSFSKADVCENHCQTQKRHCMNALDTSFRNKRFCSETGMKAVKIYKQEMKPSPFTCSTNLLLFSAGHRSG